MATANGLLTNVNAPYQKVQTADQLHTTTPDASLLSNLSQGFANLTTQNAIVTALGAGVFPPNYLTPQHYLFHHRMGQNVRCAPLLLPLTDQPNSDLNYPSRAMLEQIGQPELLLENKVPGAPQQIFPPFDVPPAPPSLPWIPSMGL